MSSQDAGAGTVHRTACTLDCPDTCTLQVTVRDGRITDIDASPADDSNPFSKGFICRKVQRSVARVSSPDRIAVPLVRDGAKGDGVFRETTWDEALDLIARRISDAIAEDGTDSVIPYLYNSSSGLLESSGATVELFARLGCPEVEHSICAKTYGDAWDQVYPGLESADPLATEHAQLLVLWGANPTVSNTHLPPHVTRFTQSGGTLVVIDPRRTAIAARADLHLAVVPGTDSILAMATVAHLERTGRIDQRFVRDHVSGDDEFLAACRGWALDEAARECGVEPDAVARFADLVADVDPAMLRLGWGVERNRNGGSGMLAVLSLWAMAGNFGRLGSGVIGSTSSGTSGVLAAELPAVDVPRSRLNMNHVGRVLRGEMHGWPRTRVLFVQGANPAVTAVDQIGFLKGLAREDLFTVVHEQVLTDTARHADVVLPATTQFEVDDVAGSYGSFTVQRVHRAVAPFGASRSNNRLGRDLGERLGVVLTTPDAHGLLGEDIVRTRRTEETVQFRDVFPRGNRARVHVPSSELPLPRPERGRADLGEGLRLITPATSRTVNSMFAEYDPPEAVVTLNPADAARRSLVDGDLVSVSSATGTVRMAVRVSEAMRSGVCEIPKGLWMRHGADGRVSNALVDDTVNDLGGGACFNESVVTVRKENNDG